MYTWECTSLVTSECVFISTLHCKSMFIIDCTVL